MNNVGESVQYIIDNLRTINPPTSLLINMDNLSQDELLSFYEQCVVEQLTIKLNYYFNLLVQQDDKHSFFIHLITHCSSIDEPLMQSILSKLSWDNILDLTARLLTQKKCRDSAQEYTTSIHQVVYFLFQTLNDTTKPSMSLYSWPHNNALSRTLLGSVGCINQLAQTNLTLLNWLSWKSTSQVNDANLNLLLSYTPQSVSDVLPEVLVWLSVFQEQPAQLIIIIKKLTNISKSTIQETNFTHIKQALCLLLRPTTPYEETSFFSLLSSSLQLTTQIPALITSTKEQCSSYQHAQLVAYSKKDLLYLFTPEEIHSLLLHSLQDKTRANWDKVALWLNTQEEEVQYEWLHKLTTQSTSVVFNQRAYQFIHSVAHYAKFRERCQESELAYFLSYANEQDYSIWLTYLVQRHERQALNIEIIVGLLPPHHKKITLFLQQHSLIDATLIASLILKQEHLTHLQKYIKAQDKIWLSSFLLTFHDQIEKTPPSSEVLSIISDLIIGKKEEWSAELAEDQRLMHQYATLLVQLATTSSNEPLQQTAQLGIFSLLDAFIHLSQQWASYLFQQPFIHTLFTYFLPPHSSFTLEYIATHPLTQLCLAPEIKNLFLTNNKEDEQTRTFIFYLLLHTPEELTTKQFMVLFDLLINEQQHDLAQAILILPELKAGQKNNIRCLIQHLTFEETFTCLAQAPKGIVLHELLFTNETTEPSSLQWQKILDKMSLQDLITCLNNDNIEASIRSKRFVSLLAYIIQHVEHWDKKQTLWLCQQGMLLVPHTPELLASLLKICIWDNFLFLLETYPHYRFILLRTAMQHSSYEEEITQSFEIQNDFLTQLLTYDFSTAQLAELIANATPYNKTIHSLIILCFLQYKEHTNHLIGNSLLEALHNTQTYHPSRLGSLLHCINPMLLNERQINTLSEETCFALLCCIPHFHQWTDQQIQLLLNKLPQPKCIRYWLNHYYNVPHAASMLAHFLKVANDVTLKEIRQLPLIQKRALLHQVIEYLDLFSAEQLLVEEADEESHLIKAIKRYNRGESTNLLIHLIQYLIQKLHDQGHNFSLKAAALLIPLQEDSLFNAQHHATAYLINHYLKSYAQLGIVNVFYVQGEFNLACMQRMILVRPQYPVKEKELHDHLLTPIFHPKTQKNIFFREKTHLLLEIMAAKKITHISALDYFLIHYKGNKETLANVLHAYLNALSQHTPCTEAHKKSLHYMVTFMTRTELSPNIKETIYEVLLHYPDLYDEHTSSCLFLFDAIKTIQHFGMQGTLDSYQQVIKLCQMALQNLDSIRHSTHIYHAEIALNEAQIELAYLHDKSFFSALIYFAKRCWVYGWTGFFSLNAPTYVLPAHQSIARPSQKTIVQEHAQTIFVKKNVHTLINELSEHPTVAQLDELIALLEECNYKKTSVDEPLIRTALHQLLPQIQNQGTINSALTQWLAIHLHVFESNYLHLVEYLLAHHSLHEVRTIVEEQQKHLEFMPHILRELKSATPLLGYTIALKEEQTGKKDQHNTWQWPSFIPFFKHQSNVLATQTDSSKRTQKMP